MARPDHQGLDNVQPGSPGAGTLKQTPGSNPRWMKSGAKVTQRRFHLFQEPVQRSGQPGPDARNRAGHPPPA